MFNLSWVLALGITLLSSWLFRKLSWTYSFWARRGVPGPMPFPLLGNIVGRLAREPLKSELSWARQFGSFYGLYYGTRPVLTVTHPELIKQVLVKDFTSASSHRVLPFYDQIFNQNLFHLEGESWRRVRTIVTPAFSSGKLKSMAPTMARCIGQLDRYLEKTLHESGNTVDIRKLFSGFTIDVIAATAFATETNANDTQGKRSAFVVNGTKLFHFPIHKIVAYLAFPRWLNDLLGIRNAFPNAPFNFFIQLCQQIIRERQDKQFNRKDLVQLLMDAYAYESDLKDSNYDRLEATDKTLNDHDESKETKSSVKKKLSETEIVANCFLFFIGGFETTATSLSYLFYELAMNSEIQERLYEEVVQTTSDLAFDSSEYFESLMNNSPYLDAVVKESLRKYPPIARIERRVEVDQYKLDIGVCRKEQNIALPRGLIIEIPPLAVHRNPDYYSEPEVFKPERWLPENRNQLVPNTYLPFGAGPRNCIGARFAMQEIKLCLARLIVKYRFSRNNFTPEELRFYPAMPVLTARQISLDISLR